jgi:hypothetical protein
MKDPTPDDVGARAVDGNDEQEATHYNNAERVAENFL